MRNRTEQVTTTLAESENEEDQSDVDDSEEDWKPAKKDAKGGKAAAATKPSPKAAAPKRKSTPAAAKGKAKKSKKEESEESEDEIDEEEVEDEEEEDEEEDEAESKPGKKQTTPAQAKTSRQQGGKNIPDKDGKFELYLFKNDLSKDFRNDPKLCMWRRDGSSLLQKYIKVKEEDVQPNERAEIIFAASSVYSCWEEKRKHDFFQINVQCIGDKKEGKVKVLDVEELTKFALEDRPATEAKKEEPVAPADDEEEGDEEEDGEDEE